MSTKGDIPDNKIDSKEINASISNLPPKEWMSRGFYVSLGVLILFVCAFIIRQIGSAALSIASPFVVGLAFAVLIDPLVKRIQSRHIRRPFAAAIVFLGLLVAIIGSLYIIIPALVDQAGQLAKEGPLSIGQLRTTIDLYLQKHHKIGPFKLPNNFGALQSQLTDNTSAYIQKYAGNLAQILLGSASMVLRLIISLIVTFYLLIDFDQMRARLYFLLPRKHRHTIRQVAEEVSDVFIQYLRNLVIVCFLYGVTDMCALYGLSLFHPKLAHYALLIGAIAGVLYAVPYLGALTTSLICFIVAFTSGNIVFALWTVVCIISLNQIFDNVITPRVVGGGVGLHPLVSIFALALGGQLFQFWGLLLSVPIAGSVQVILFRLFPKLSQPTPDEFLISEGIDPQEPKLPDIPAGGEP